MKILRRLFSAMLASTALVGAALAADANVAGEWDFTVETQAGTGTPHFSLTQDGSNVTGTVKGNELTINFKVNAQGTDLAITYTGEVDGSSIKGKVSLGELGEGSFTGKKSG
jgi:hypothetical protein